MCPGCDSPTGACHKLHITSFPNTSTSNIKWQGCFHLSLDLLLRSWMWTLIWAPVKGGSISCCLVYGLEQYFYVEGTLPPEPKKLVKYAASFIVVEGTRYNILSFTWDGSSWLAPDHWTPKNIADGVVPWNFHEVFLPSSEACVSYWVLQHSRCILLTRPD